LREIVAALCAPEPTLTPWWVLTLVEQLPEGSAFQAALAGGPAWRGWDTSRYLLADIFDATQNVTVATIAAAGAKGMKPAAPWPRPGATARSEPGGGRPMADLARQMRAALAAEKSPTTPEAR
jgi:hypothetical protein